MYTGLRGSHDSFADAATYTAAKKKRKNNKKKANDKAKEDAGTNEPREDNEVDVDDGEADEDDAQEQTKRVRQMQPHA